MAGSRHLTDEDITRVRILHDDAGKTVAQICRTTGFSRHQVRRAVTATQGPRRRKGPSPVIGPEEEAELVRFITESQRNRSLSWKKVAEEFMDGRYGEKSIRNALQRLGYKRFASHKNYWLTKLDEKPVKRTAAKTKEKAKDKDKETAETTETAETNSDSG